MKLLIISLSLILANSAVAESLSCRLYTGVYPDYMSLVGESVVRIPQKTDPDPDVLTAATHIKHKMGVGSGVVDITFFAKTARTFDKLHSSYINFSDVVVNNADGSNQQIFDEYMPPASLDFPIVKVFRMGDAHNNFETFKFVCRIEK